MLLDFLFKQFNLFLIIKWKFYYCNENKVLQTIQTKIVLFEDRLDLTFLANFLCLKICKLPKLMFAVGDGFNYLIALSSPIENKKI